MTYVYNILRLFHIFLSLFVIFSQVRLRKIKNIKVSTFLIQDRNINIKFFDISERLKNVD